MCLKHQTFAFSKSKILYNLSLVTSPGVICINLFNLESRRSGSAGFFSPSNEWANFSLKISKVWLLFTFYLSEQNYHIFKKNSTNSTRSWKYFTFSAFSFLQMKKQRTPPQTMNEVSHKICCFFGKPDFIVTRYVLSSCRLSL